MASIAQPGRHNVIRRAAAKKAAPKAAPPPALTGKAADAPPKAVDKSDSNPVQKTDSKEAT
jgi:hypothetical protein